MAITQEMPKPRPERQSVPRSSAEAPEAADALTDVATAADLSLAARPSVDVASDVASPTTSVDAAGESRHEAVAHAAYLLAKARGFEPGHELDDWLAAEQQLTALC